MRVLFTKDHDVGDPRVEVTAYKAGTEATVTREVGEAAVKAGAAREVPLDKDQAED